MLISEWKRLKTGDKIYYMSAPGAEFRNTLCLVTKPYPDITLKIVEAGDYGYTEWAHGYDTANDWEEFEAHKFELSSPAKPLPLDQRINLKIKDLDKTWALQQQRKGKNYALLLL